MSQSYLNQFKQMRLQSLAFLFFVFVFSRSLVLQDPTSCPSTHYFNSTLLSCVQCSENSQPTSDKSSCVCKNRYRSSYDSATNRLTCVLCDSGTFTFPPDTTKCYSAATTNVVDNNGLPTCTQDNYIPERLTKSLKLA